MIFIRWWATSKKLLFCGCISLHSYNVSNFQEIIQHLNNRSGYWLATMLVPKLNLLIFFCQLRLALAIRKYATNSSRPACNLELNWQYSWHLFLAKYCVSNHPNLYTVQILQHLSTLRFCCCCTPRVSICSLGLQNSLVSQLEPNLRLNTSVL